ncbi:DEAD/DEAH box helicase [Vibrio sp.]|nr:DEAD/DEAH box helicase [Vibrio sp.]
MTASFEQLGLTPEICYQLKKLNFSTPSEVQQASIPAILKGKDVLAGAQTGTGKTAAYGLPVIQMLLSNVAWDPLSPAAFADLKATAEADANTTSRPNLPSPSALILVPTRELAQQVSDNLEQYSEGLGLSIVTAYGGVSVSVQQKKLRSGCDILIATTGRLLDHLHCKNVTLSQVKHVVFDEADRMLDMGFMPDIQRLMRQLPREKQILLFSATFDQKIKTLAYKWMQEPEEIQVTPENSTADQVKQMVYPVDKKRKAELLAYLIGSRNWKQVLVFTKTKQGSDALAKELKLDGIKAASINGDKSQGARQKALDDFKAGRVRALIATDVAARGLDIHQLEQVVNYELPFKAEDYIHRIGRTGRAGHTGFAVSLMSKDEYYLLDAIERLLDQKLPQEWLQGFEPSLNEDIESDKPQPKQGRSSEKRRMKAKLKIHANRGKRK